MHACIIITLYACCLYLIVFINILCSHFTAIIALPEFNNILPSNISIKMNEIISLKWTIYNQNVPNYYYISVKMGKQNISEITSNYKLELYICELIVYADFEVNSTDVQVDGGIVQFALCANLKEGELGKNITCTNATSVKIDSKLQGNHISCLCMDM